MGSLVLASAALGLAVYGLLIGLPWFSPRRELVSRLGPPRTKPGQPLPEAGLARDLRLFAATRHLPPEQFRLIQTALAGAGFICAGYPWLLFHRPVAWPTLVLYPALLWAAPAVWLRLELCRRRALLARRFPDLLFHLVIQTGAGVSVVQALTSAAAVLHEPLRTELADLNSDLRTMPLPAALQRLADRCGVPEIHALVQTVIHQQSLGIALPAALANADAQAKALARRWHRRRAQIAATTAMMAATLLLLSGLLTVMPLLAPL